MKKELFFACFLGKYSVDVSKNGPVCRRKKGTNREWKSEMCESDKVWRQSLVWYNI